MKHTDVNFYALTQQPIDTLLEIKNAHRVRIVDGLTKSLAFRMGLLNYLDLSDSDFFHNNQQRLKIVFSDFKLLVNDLLNLALQLAYGGKVLKYYSEAYISSPGGWMPLGWNLPLTPPADL
ncbi:hypothetical protein C8R42DRAFT_724102 [Lentinula raphanica]|nr:hypothetical protein C8R42DRAFT_724102 [Lentinula raphanica]